MNVESGFRQPEPVASLAEIDRQHQNLIRIIQNLRCDIDARRGQQVIGTVLAELVTYMIYHFAAEEDLMQHHGFPGIAEHRIEHNHLTLKICGFQEEHEARKPEAAEKLLKYLQHWLEEHTLERDKDYVQFSMPKV